MLNKKSITLSALLLFIALWLISGNEIIAQQQERFVRVEDGTFKIGEDPYHYTGINLWYAMNLGAKAPGGNRERLIRELDMLDSLGVDNLRIMAGSEGPNSEPWRVKPAVQPEPGEYDERLLKGLDFALAEMEKRDMRGVLVLNNFFQWTGGMAQYVAWATGEEIPYPNTGEHSWDEFMRYSARFYAIDEAKQIFYEYIEKLVTRKNTVTGEQYKNDPTIMAWQLANEPRGFQNSDEYVQWVDEAAGYIKKLDSNHLVSLGGEGKILGIGEATQFERVSKSPYLDYLTIHIWLENWGWLDPKRPEETLFPAMGKAMGYLADHVHIAEEVNKPLVVEEFGVGRDQGSYDPGASVNYRNEFYTTLYEALLKLAEEETAVAGSNVWGWAGVGRPANPGEPWQKGDPFIGDPPHENLGWYSIYNKDKSTLSILSEYAQKMSEISK